jgi:hypothetical protein
MRISIMKFARARYPLGIRRRIHQALSLAFALGALATDPARADLVGATVTVTGLFDCASAGPTGVSGCTVFGGPETHTVASGGTDFTTLAFDGFVTVAGDQLIWNATSTVSYSGPQFNGYEFDISGAPALTSISVDPATNLGPATNNYSSGGLLIGGNEVLMDLNGLSAIAGQKTVFDVAFSGGVVPEPASWVLLIAGFMGLGWAGYRHQRVAARTARMAA